MSETTLLVTVVGTGIGGTAVVVSVLALVASGINSRLRALGSELSGRIDKTNDRIDALGGEMRGELATFRGEMREELATFRGEMRGELAAFRSEMRGELATLRREVREDHAALDARIRDVGVELAKVDQRLETVERAILPQAPPAA